MQNFLYSFVKKYSSKKNYKPDISCGIMDIKYNDNNLKILEFGEIEYSAFKGHESLYGPGKIWGNLWLYLAQFKKQIWYASSKGSSLSNDKAIDILYKVNGIRTKSFEDLEKDINFKNANQANTNSQASNLQENNLKTKIQDYNGIIVIKNRSNRKSIIDKLSEFVVLNDRFTKYCENKHQAALLFKNKALENFKPAWKSYEFKYSKDLAAKISKDLKCETFVIKPVNATRGEGIIIVEEKNLDKTLKKMLCNNNFIKNMGTEYEYWAKYKENIFLVESFEESKLILVDKKKYDATMRIVFVMSSDCNQIEFKIIGAYWKLPVKSISETGSLNEKHKSKISRSATASAKVSPEDVENVGKIMKTIIPKIYKKILES